MKLGSCHKLSTSPPAQPARKLRKTASLALRQWLIYGRSRRYITGKELDRETGLYYYGARYLDPKISRWLSGDPAVGEYIPSVPVNEEARKRNGNLPGMGGVFNYVNLHVYHYGGNNPVKLVDPDGRNDEYNQLLEDYYDTGYVNAADLWNALINEENRKIDVFVRNSPEIMAQMAGQSLLDGAEFMSRNGSKIAAVCYASGLVEIGLVIDGTVVVSKVTLNIYDFTKHRRADKFIISMIRDVGVFAVGYVSGALVKSHMREKMASFGVRLTERQIDQLSNMLASMYSDIYENYMFENRDMLNAD